MCFYNCLCDPLIHSTGMLIHKCFCLSSADSRSVLIGNHKSRNGDSKINTVTEKLQDSLVLKASLSSAAGKSSTPQPSPPKMFNGRNSSTTENCSSNKTPPVPPRSTHTNHSPVPHPRTSLSVPSSGTSGGQRAAESPKLLRNTRAEALNTLPSRGSGQATENFSQTNKLSAVKSSTTAPCNPRIISSSLQKRSPSPMREQGHLDAPQRIRTPEPSGSTSLRDLPPPSPNMSRKGAPGLQGSALPLASKGFSGKSAPGSPQGHRKLTTRTEAMRPLHAQSAAPLSGLVKSCPGSANTSGFGSSPLASPHSQRKASCVTTAAASSKEQNLIKPYTRERKNSISEISDNEDELLEYHRWQREERMREQEMEKLVSD